MNISTNIVCAALNYLRLDDRALSNLRDADLPTNKEFLQLLKKEIGFEVDSIAIIKKCNAVMLLVSFCDDLSQDFVHGRLLHSWDTLSKYGIVKIKRDIKFYENIEALKFLAECAIGVHSVTVGDSQVLSQVVDGLHSNLSISESRNIFDFICDWLLELAEECRHKTDIFKGNTSIERLASELVCKQIKKGCSALVIGYGKSGKLVVKILNQENNIPVHIINRTRVSLEEGKFNNSVTYSSPETFSIPNNIGAVVVAVDNTPETEKIVSDIVYKIPEGSAVFVDLSTPPILKNKIKDYIDVIILSEISERIIDTRKNEVNKARKIIDQQLKYVVERSNAYFAALYVNAQKSIAIPLKDPERQRLIQERSDMLRHIRSQLEAKNFLEIITPFIVGISTDPPKVDKGGTIDVDWMNGARAFLRQSNQIYKQIYVASGMKKVYEIGPFWRKEVSESYRHLQESIGLDVEIQRPRDLRELYEFACELIKSTNDDLVKKYKLNNRLQIPNLKDIPVLTYHEAVELLRKNGYPVTRGSDFGLVSEAKLGQLIKKDSGSDILVIIDYPDTIKKFYTKQKEGGLTETFDIIVDGWELVSGAIRQTDGDLIRKSMKLSDINVSEYEFYIGIVDGAQEHGGFCLGLDRLLAKILDKEMVSDAVPFPRTYKKLIP